MGMIGILPYFSQTWVGLLFLAELLPLLTLASPCISHAVPQSELAKLRNYGKISFMTHDKFLLTFTACFFFFLRLWEKRNQGLIFIPEYLAAAQCSSCVIPKCAFESNLSLRNNMSWKKVSSRKVFSVIINIFFAQRCNPLYFCSWFLSFPNAD